MSSCFIYTEPYAHLLDSPFWSVLSETLKRDPKQPCLFVPSSAIQAQVTDWLKREGVDAPDVHTFLSYLQTYFSLSPFNPIDLLLRPLLEAQDFGPFSGLVQTQGFYRTCVTLFDQLDTHLWSKHTFLTAHHGPASPIAEPLYAVYEAYCTARETHFPQGFWPHYAAQRRQDFQTWLEPLRQRPLFFVGFTMLKPFEKLWVEACVHAVPTSSFLLPYVPNSHLYQAIEPTYAFLYTLTKDSHVISPPRDTQKHKAKRVSCQTILEECQAVQTLTDPTQKTSVLLPQDPLWAYTASACGIASQNGLSITYKESPFLRFLEALHHAAESRFSRTPVLALLKSPFVRVFQTSDGVFSRIQPDCIHDVASEQFIRKGLSEWVVKFGDYIHGVQSEKIQSSYSVGLLKRQLHIVETLFQRLRQLRTAPTAQEWERTLSALVKRFIDPTVEQPALSQRLLDGFFDHLHTFCAHAQPTYSTGSVMFKQFMDFLHHQQVVLAQNAPHFLSTHIAHDGFILPDFDHLILPQAHAFSPRTTHTVAYLNYTLGKDPSDAWIRFITGCYAQLPALTVLAPPKEPIPWLSKTSLISEKLSFNHHPVSRETRHPRPYLTPWIAKRLAPPPAQLSPQAQALFKKMLHTKPVSPTSLELYQGCPKRYFFRYALRLKEKTTFVEDISPAKWGTLIHEFLYQLFTSYPTLSVTETQLRACAETCFKHVAGDDLNWDIKRDAFFGVEGNPGFLHALFHFLKENPFPLAASKFEHPFTVTLPLKEPLALTFKGTMDVILKEDHKVMIVDYKTGSKVPSGTMCKTFSSLQMPLYMLAAQQLFPGHDVIGSMIYQVKDADTLSKKVLCVTETDRKRVMAGNRSRPFPLTPSYFEDLMTYLSHLMTLLYEGHFSTEPTPLLQDLESTRPTTQCRHCSYRPICRYPKRFSGAY